MNPESSHDFRVHLHGINEILQPGIGRWKRILRNKDDIRSVSFGSTIVSRFSMSKFGRLNLKQTAWIFAAEHFVKMFAGISQFLRTGDYQAEVL